MYHDLKVGIRLECSSSRETASEAIALNRGGGGGRRGCGGQFYGTLSTWPGSSPQLLKHKSRCCCEGTL